MVALVTLEEGVRRITHVPALITGIKARGLVARGYAGGRLTPGHVETVGLYWHFVDLVWMFVVPLIYLLNLSR